MITALLLEVSFPQKKKNAAKIPSMYFNSLLNKLLSKILGIKKTGLFFAFLTNSQYCLNQETKFDQRLVVQQGFTLA